MANNDKDVKYTVLAEDRFGRVFQRLRGDMTSVASGADDLRGNLAGANTSFAALAGGPITAVTVAVGAAGLAIRTLAADLDAFNDSADAIGDSIENISAVEDVARRTGGDLELVTSTLVKMNQVLLTAKDKSPAARALNDIGLQANELRRLEPTEALRRIAAALATWGDDQNKARITQELFGKSLREVAPLLKDLAEAGERNVTVTTEQAAEAEKFNRQLAELSTNASNAARSVANRLLPAINDLFARGRQSDAFAGLRDIDKDRRAQLAAEAEVVKAAGALAFARADVIKRALSPDAYRASVARAEAEVMASTARMKKAQADYYGLTDGSAGGGRGFVNPAAVRPALPDTTNDGEEKDKAKTSEAQRYLEQLQKQGEKLRELTDYEQVLLDISKRRIDGLTPAIEAQIRAQARANDLAKQQRDQREAAIASTTAQAQAALDNVAALQDQNKELEAEIRQISLTPAALADLELARIRNTIALRQQTIAEREAAGVGEERLQVLNAEVEALRKREQLVIGKVRADAEAAARNSSTDIVADDTSKDLAESISQGILDGARNGRSIMDVFRREIEAQFAKTILRPIVSPIAQAGNAILEQVFGNIASMLFSGGSPVGINDGAYLPDILRGGRANGGRVRAGGRYRVNENGIEEFVPDVDGTILSGSQTAARARGDTYHQSFTNQVIVQGDASERTIALIQAAINRNNAAMARSRATGGMWAGR